MTPMRMGRFWRVMCSVLGHKWSDCDLGFCDRCHYWIPERSR